VLVWKDCRAPLPTAFAVVCWSWRIKLKSIRLDLDALGMRASTLCMTRCLVFPLLLAALPMWKLMADAADHNVAGQLAIGPSDRSKR